MHAVRVEHLTKRFDTTNAVNDVSLALEPGELFTLLGPSGCGKTTLLRLLAGLESPDQGFIAFFGQRVDSRPAHERNIGMVFQSYALFPHMSVAENVAYGLKARKVDRAEIAPRVAEALDLVQMSQFAARRPDQLSGGQQQRVALARALATRPALLLMDEPLSNLDAQLRVAMREEIRSLQKRVGITTVYVTHDQEEALAISDRIGVMEQGRLRQVGTPYEIYALPASRMVAGFVGTCSFLGAHLSGQTIEAGGVRFQRAFANGYAGPALMGLRPEAARLMPADWHPPAGEVALPVVTAEEVFLGTHVRVRVRLLKTDERLTVNAGGAPGAHPPGGRCALAFRPADALFFAAGTEEAIR